MEKLGGTMSKSNHNLIQIVGSGSFQPQNKISSAQIDEKMGYKTGLTERITGVVSRNYATDESATDLAVKAVELALQSASLGINEIDCVISASGTMEQAIPYNAARLHRQLSLSPTVVAFDINMTCLGSLMAIDMAANLIQTGRFKTILIYASELASVGVNWENIEIGGLFGDGAAALIVTGAKSGGIITSLFETHSDAYDFCQIKGGGSLNHPSKVIGDYKSYGQFEMQGREVYRYSAKVLLPFLEKLLLKVDLNIDEIDWVIPHQASSKALELMQKRLEINSNKIINIINTHGNQISASIPTALDKLIKSGQLNRGDKLLFIGTSAGLSLGGIIWQW